LLHALLGHMSPPGFVKAQVASTLQCDDTIPCRRSGSASEQSRLQTWGLDCVLERAGFGLLAPVCKQTFAFNFDQHLAKRVLGAVTFRYPWIPEHPKLEWSFCRRQKRNSTVSDARGRPWRLPRHVKAHSCESSFLPSSIYETASAPSIM